MKALMFGWEFPPHILGGLGTASFGLTRGMAMQPDMDITFCIPKPWGLRSSVAIRCLSFGKTWTIIMSRSVSPRRA